MKKNKCHLGVAIICCAAMSSVQAKEIHLSGFVTVGGGLVENENSVSHNGYSEEDLTFNKNLLGLQVDGKVADKLTATAQIIARSGSDYQMNTEWAYLSWQVADNTKIRMGRLRTPFYIYSDSLDVGYSYTWITPPIEVYSVTFNNVDGIDIYNIATLGAFDTTLQAYFGSFEDDTELQGVASTIKTRNQMGLAATLGKDWWTFRLAYHQADLTLASAQFTSLAGGLDFYGGNGSELLVDGDKSTFIDLGLNIDTGKFIAAVEHTEIEAKHSFLAKNIREYIMGGVRVDDFLIHLTLSRAKDEMTQVHPEANVDVNPATLEILAGAAALMESGVSKHNVIALGTRWDITAGTAFKLELSSVKLAGHDPAKSADAREQKILAVAVQTVF